MLRSVTVAICTWNRAPLLDQTLAEMRNLRIPSGVEWELLVVNNNCTDDTDTVLARHAAHLPLRRLLESKQGHSNARNCAVEAARGELLLFTDDDVLADPEWLAEHHRAALSWPQAAFFGGPVHPWFLAEPLPLIRENILSLSNAFALIDLGSEERPLADQENPFGANIAFRTGVIKNYLFDPRFGRVKKGLIGDDESQVIERLREAGHTGVWVGGAKVKHCIPPERATWQFIWNYYQGLGQSSARRNGIASCPTFWGLPRWLLRRHAEHRLKSWLGWTFGRPSWVKQYINAAITLGLLRECRSYPRSGADRERPESPGRYLVPPHSIQPAETGTATTATLPDPKTLCQAQDCTP